MPYAAHVENRTSDDTFGRVWTSTTPSAESHFAFTGRDLDPESDLYRARYYDPATAQFISADPIGFEAGDGNLYRDVGNGPIDRMDPSGLVPPEDLKNRLEDMVHDPKAKEEARRIAAAIANTFKNNSAWWRFPKIQVFGPDQRHKRIYCYEWAWAFHDAFEHESSGNYFDGRVESSITANLRVHYWLRIRTKDEPRAIYVDDGFWATDDATGERIYIHDERPTGGAYKFDPPGPISDKPRDQIWAPPFYDAAGIWLEFKPRYKPQLKTYDHSQWGQLHGWGSVR